MNKKDGDLIGYRPLCAEKYSYRLHQFALFAQTGAV